MLSAERKYYVPGADDVNSAVKDCGVENIQEKRGVQNVDI